MSCPPDSDRPPPRLPVTFSNGQDELRSVCEIAGEEAAPYATDKICATCRNFRLRDGQEVMEREQFLKQLVLEYGWKTRHLGAPPDTFGLCAAGDASTLTSAYATCDQYTPRKGRITR